MCVQRRTNWVRRFTVSLAVLSSGGTLLGGCQTRVKEAVVNGSKAFISQTLTGPDTVQLIVDALTPPDTEN